MQKRISLKERLSARIDREKANVFLRGDFKDLGDYDQIGRALIKLAQEGKLVRIGYGLYARAKISPLTGETVPTVSLPNLGREALSRLKIRTVPSTADVAYRDGRSTQVPTGRVIGVRRRISRKISYKGIQLTYEYITG